MRTAVLSTSCKSAGVFSISCTSYLLCVFHKGVLVGIEVTCPSQQNFDPQTYRCSSSYICSSCTTAGFVCPNSTLFTLCAAVGVAIVSNQPCPSEHYCNNRCKFPCLRDVDTC
jgi:hypothetical protein